MVLFRYFLIVLLAVLNREDVCFSSAKLTETAANISTAIPESDPCHAAGNVSKCDPHTEICTRSGKSYKCDCKQGFNRNSETGQCKVFDACLGKNNCSENAQCINEIGSYKCICKSGYVGDGMECKDKNECDDRVSNECHKYALCINKDGGYTCRCRKGFEQHKEGRLCIRKVFDDACLRKNNCSENAQCINEIGSYKCICKSGYVGNGMECKDKNECDDRVSNECHKYALCINKDGGYTCRCRKGFEQHKEGRLCIRKNEVSTKTLVVGGLIAGVPLLTFAALTIFLCKRRLRRQMLDRQAVYSPESPPNDDIMPPDNQQLILGADSYYQENIPMKGMPASESAWSEWPDYDETRGSDSD